MLVRMMFARVLISIEYFKLMICISIIYLHIYSYFKIPMTSLFILTMSSDVEDMEGGDSKSSAEFIKIHLINSNTQRSEGSWERWSGNLSMTICNTSMSVHNFFLDNQ